MNGIRLIILAAAAMTASGDTFTDGFEAGVIDPFWTVTGPGSATITTATAHTGTRSLNLTASPNFPWAVTLSHDFGAPVSGSVSAWVLGNSLCCGSGAGLQLILGSAQFLWQQAGGVNSPSQFTARLLPGAGPEIDTTLTASDSLWHQFRLDVLPSGVSFYFDGALAYSNSSITSFQSVDLTVWGGPGGTAFYDDFSISTTPEPSSLVLIALPIALALMRLRQVVR